VSSEEKIPLDSVEPVESGMSVKRVLRKEVEIPSQDALVSKTIPQIDAPYIIGELEEVVLEENKEIPINVKAEYEGMKLHFIDDELYLGKFRLGWKTTRTELLGRTGKSEFLLRRKLNDDKVKYIKLKLIANSPLKVGDLIIAQSDLKLNGNIRYFIFEEPVPSGTLYIGEYELQVSRYDPGVKYSGSSYRFNYSHIEPRYEKVSYFWYSSGNRTIGTSYRLVAPGEYMVPPSKVWGMYDEEYYGTSDSFILEIESK
ncbi:MAG: hypothetical protein ACOC80_10010, partial [Petrotogales bacterium]